MSAVFELAPPIDALALARLFGWAHPVAGNVGPRLEQWYVLLHRGPSAVGPDAALPIWGSWQVQPTLGGRPSGAPLVPEGQVTGPFALGRGDVVYAIRIGRREPA